MLIFLFCSFLALLLRSILVAWLAHNGSGVNVWILPPTVNDENDINNQLARVQSPGEGLCRHINQLKWLVVPNNCQLESLRCDLGSFWFDIYYCVVVLCTHLPLSRALLGKTEPRPRASLLLLLLLVSLERKAPASCHRPPAVVFREHSSLFWTKVSVALSAKRPARTGRHKTYHYDYYYYHFESAVSRSEDCIKMKWRCRYKVWNQTIGCQQRLMGFVQIPNDGHCLSTDN